MKKNMKTKPQPAEFKMRAECISDALIIKGTLQPWLLGWRSQDLTVEHDGKSDTLPDVEVQFSLKPDGPCLAQLQWICDSLADCHVAAETVALAKDYTGERVALDDAARRPERPTPEQLRQMQASVLRLHAYLNVECHRANEATEVLEAAASGVELRPDRKGYLAVLRHKATGLTSIHRISAARTQEKAGHEVGSRMLLLQQ